ncbi:transposase InsO family protein [Haloactinomyces albus]|uniref:Transposase InsO family protein n=1 Tax=Haloactinomyces albus TaxID=1352928 RepID=A0AAE4CPZ7_9ACTN|nr:transposase InsO family protein [Haloactinomyces albus]
MARSTVERLMRENGWRGTTRTKKVRTTVFDPTAEQAPDLVKRRFAADCPDELRVADFVRREARFDRVVMKGHHRWGVAESWPKLRAAEIPGTGVRVDSGPDNDESYQNCQMVRARLARRRGIREEPVSERPSSATTSPKPGCYGQRTT